MNWMERVRPSRRNVATSRVPADLSDGVHRVIVAQLAAKGFLLEGLHERLDGERGHVDGGLFDLHAERPPRPRASKAGSPFEMRMEIGRPFSSGHAFEERNYEIACGLADRLGLECRRTMRMDVTGIYSHRRGYDCMQHAIETLQRVIDPKHFDSRLFDMARAAVGRG